VGSLVAGWREGAAHRSSAARADLCTLDHYEVTPNQAYDIQLNGAPSNDSLPSRRRRDRDPLSLPRLWSSAGQHTDPSQREARQVHKGLDIESIDNALDTSEGPTWVGRALRSMSPGLPSTFPDPGPFSPYAPGDRAVRGPRSPQRLRGTRRSATPFTLASHPSEAYRRSHNICGSLIRLAGSQLRHTSLLQTAPQVCLSTSVGAQVTAGPLPQQQ